MFLFLESVMYVPSLRVSTLGCGTSYLGLQKSKWIRAHKKPPLQDWTRPNTQNHFGAEQETLEKKIILAISCSQQNMSGAPKTLIFPN